MQKMGQINVSPGQGEKVLEQACQILKSGRSVTIFPEGLISPAGGGFTPPQRGGAPGAQQRDPGDPDRDFPERQGLPPNPGNLRRRAGYHHLVFARTLRDHHRNPDALPGGRD